MNKVLDVQSMTGFAQGSGSLNNFSWVWETKSLNSKGLDIRIRLPNGFGELEQEARRCVKKTFKRGSVGLSLTTTRVGVEQKYFINNALLSELVLASQKLAKEMGGGKHSVDSLFSVKGVVEAEEMGSDPEINAKQSLILENLQDTLHNLLSERLSEGKKILKLLQNFLTSLLELIDQAEDIIKNEKESIRKSILDKIKYVLELDIKLPEERIAQEVAILLIKGDVREELDRLRIHINSLEELLASGGVIGRKLEFACQELGREANTICSKTNNIQLSKIGIELKTLIDEMREQVQNIE